MTKKITLSNRLPSVPDLQLSIETIQEIQDWINTLELDPYDSDKCQYSMEMGQYIVGVNVFIRENEEDYVAIKDTDSGITVTEELNNFLSF